MRPLHPLLLVCAALAASLPAQLAGTYTINPTVPTGGSNFASLLDATTALAAQGVVAPVTMLLYDDAGPFTETTTFTTANVVYTPSTAVLVMTSWTGTSATNRVTFKAAPGELPVFDATGRAMGVFWGGADFVTLQGVEIKNAINDAISLYAEATHGVANDPIIDGCRLHDCGATGVTVYGNSSLPVNTLIQNCTFWRLQTTNAGGFNTTARFGHICTRRSTNTRVVHNTFVADVGAGSMFCILGSNTSAVAETPFAEVSNNVFVKTTGATTSIFRFQTIAGSTAPVPPVCESNCFFDTSGGALARYGAAGATIAQTLLDWQTNALRDLASVQGDPLFRAPLAADYHLTAGSPCSGASTVAAGVAADADGQPRTTAIDIGADELTAATAAVVGTGCAGTASLTPALRANEPFLGNAEFALFTSQMQPSALTVLFGSVGLGPVIPIGGGCSAYLDLGTLTSLGVALASPVGTSSVVFPLPANPVFIGFHIGYQSLVLDAGAPLGFTLSNAIDAGFAF
jgi:hypothetical protein